MATRLALKSDRCSASSNGIPIGTVTFATGILPFATAVIRTMA